MSPHDALRQTAFEILEEGLFVFLAEGEPVTDIEPVRFTMAIEGPAHRSEVGIQVSRDLARTMAANMLGLDPDEMSDGDIAAGVAEALNMVAGRLMPDIVGFGPELELHPPVAGGMPHGDVIAFDSDGGQILMWYAA
ncbi:MAG: chemotaxis protein CheX [Myxococcota bacterium]